MSWKVFRYSRQLLLYLRCILRVFNPAVWDELEKDLYLIRIEDHPPAVLRIVGHKIDCRVSRDRGNVGVQILDVLAGQQSKQSQVRLLGNVVNIVLPRASQAVPNGAPYEVAIFRQKLSERFWTYCFSGHRHLHYSWLAKCLGRLKGETGCMRESGKRN